MQNIVGIIEYWKAKLEDSDQAKFRKSPMLRKRFYRVGLLLLAGGLWGSLAQMAEGQIVANFDGGNSTSVVDAYTGKAGNGWLSAWSTINGNGTVTGNVVNTTPLTADGGNYLSVSATAGASVTSALVSRQLDVSQLSLATYTISFVFRPDSTPTGGTSEGFQIFAANASGLGGVSNNDLWEISMQANSGSGKWLVRNGASNVASTIAVTAGVDYTFTLTINPGTGYSVSISDGTTTPYTSGPLAFRGPSSSGSYIYFGASSIPAGDTAGFSVDSITITAAPEPSIFGCVALFLLVGVGVARFRKMKCRA